MAKAPCRIPARPPIERTTHGTYAAFYPAPLRDPPDRTLALAQERPGEVRARSRHAHDPTSAREIAGCGPCARAFVATRKKAAHPPFSKVGLDVLIAIASAPSPAVSASARFQPAHDPNNLRLCLLA